MISVLGIHWKDWYWSWNSNTLATWCKELTHLKRHWCWERVRPGGEGDGRGWDGWMASPTWWTWFGWTPGVGDGQGGLACCGSWGLKESDTTERLNWTESRVHSVKLWRSISSIFSPLFLNYTFSARAEVRYKCLTTGLLEKKMSWLEGLANFPSVNTPTWLILSCQCVSTEHRVGKRSCTVIWYFHPPETVDVNSLKNTILKCKVLIFTTFVLIYLVLHDLIFNSDWVQ